MTVLWHCPSLIWAPPVCASWWLMCLVITAVRGEELTWALRPQSICMIMILSSLLDYYSYYNTEQESTLKQMLGGLCTVSGSEPKPTYLHSYLHGNPAALPLFLFLHPSCSLVRPPSSPFEIKSQPLCKLWSITWTNLFSRGDSDILMKVQLQSERSQAPPISDAGL